MQSWIFNIITLVFSVTWFFRNHLKCWVAAQYTCIIIIIIIIIIIMLKTIELLQFFVETMIFFWYIESSKDQHLFEIDFINTYTIYHINITYIYCYFWSWIDWLIDCISFFQEKNSNLFQTFKL